MQLLVARSRFVAGMAALGFLALAFGVTGCGSITALSRDGGGGEDGGAGGAGGAPAGGVGGGTAGMMGGSDAGPDLRIDATVADAVDSAPRDTGVDRPPPACDLGKPFGVPAAVPGLPVDTRAPIVARFSPDELTVYFSRVDQTQVCCNYQIQVATRAIRTQPFGTPLLLDTVNSSAIDQSPSVTGDGLTMYLASDRDMALGAYRLYAATRGRAGDAFMLPEPVPMVGTTTSIDSSPYVLPPGDVIYFGSSRSGNGDIYRAARGAGGFGTATLVAGASSALLEVAPVVTDDELTIFFGSDRTGGSQGGFDVWTATRTDPSAAFGSISNVQAVNGAGDERPSFISSDGCRLYLSRTLAASYSVLMAERPR